MCECECARAVCLFGGDKEKRMIGRLKTQDFGLRDHSLGRKDGDMFVMLRSVFYSLRGVGQWVYANCLIGQGSPTLSCTVAM